MAVSKDTSLKQKVLLKTAELAKQQSAELAEKQKTAVLKEELRALKAQGRRK